MTRRLEERLKAAKVNPVPSFAASVLFEYDLEEKPCFVWCVIGAIGTEARPLVFQSRAESLQQQQPVLEPVSRLQSLRDRDTVTRFDREVSI